MWLSTSVTSRARSSAQVAMAVAEQVRVDRRSERGRRAGLDLRGAVRRDPQPVRQRQGLAGADQQGRTVHREVPLECTKIKPSQHLGVAPRSC